MSTRSEEESLLGFSIVDTLKSSDDITKNRSIQEHVQPEMGTTSEKITMANSDQSGQNEKKEELNDDNEEGEVIELDECKPQEAFQDNITITSEERFHISLDNEPIVLSTSDISSNKTIRMAKNKNIPTKRKHKNNLNYVWVSNISRRIKASDLKKLFSNIGKVSSAKILTNGRSFYGYVSMETSDLAMKCIKTLNHTKFEGKFIQVSKERPDLKQIKEANESRTSNERLDKNVKSQETNCSRSNSATYDEKSEVEISNLRKKLDCTYSDVLRLKRKLEQYERRHEGMRKKCSNLERELQLSRNENRAERRHLNQEKEDFEKTKKLQQIRFDADKAIINKELAEVKKLRENLKIKLDELKVSLKKPIKRSRSPVLRNIRSPLARNNNNRYRSEDHSDKRSKREDYLRSRTPPPPSPKLSGGRKRDGVNVATRQYYSEGEGKPRSNDSSQYDFHRKEPFQMSNVSRSSDWSASYVKDPRRPNPHQPPPVPSTLNYSMDSRFGYQQPPTTLVGIPRGSHNAHYMSEYDKTYVHY